jgi:hypothetical protein
MQGSMIQDERQLVGLFEGFERSTNETPGGFPLGIPRTVCPDWNYTLRPSAQRKAADAQKREVVS